MDRTMGDTSYPEYGRGHWWDCEHAWASNRSDQFAAQGSESDLVSNAQATNQQNFDNMLEEIR